MAIIKTEGTGGKTPTLFRPWAFDRNIQQLFDAFLDFPKDWEFPMRKEIGFPTVDISETPQQYDIRAEIPGMKKEDVKVSVNKNILTLSGEKKEEKKTEDKKYHRMESYYGSFQRSFVLPDGIKTEKVTADFKDGVLTVVVPKNEEAKEKTVDIKVS
ncbi:MAG TPA: Hsp20/alpha crystallin family protein [bacterium]|nr:Hsp20/alpha crystallin family protein [bacterium]